MTETLSALKAEVLNMQQIYNANQASRSEQINGLKKTLSSLTYELDVHLLSLSILSITAYKELNLYRRTALLQ